MLQSLTKYIKYDYWKKLDNSTRTINLLEEGRYSYSVVLPRSMAEGFCIRMDDFINTKIPFIASKGCKDCDDIIVDITNKVIYIIEIKKPSAFSKCSQRDFEIKEKNTEIFLNYFFTLCGKSDDIGQFEFIYIRWCYKKSKLDRASRSQINPYKKYSSYVEKQVYKIDKISRILIDQMRSDAENI